MRQGYPLPGQVQVGRGVTYETRAMLCDPYWALHAAKALGAKAALSWSQLCGISISSAAHCAAFQQPSRFRIGAELSRVIPCDGACQEAR